jgi:ribosomal protein S18 acetylase RimI-like enzyme
MSATAETMVRPATTADRTALARVVRDYELRVFGSAPEPAEAAATVSDSDGIQLVEIDGAPAALLRAVSDVQVVQVDLLAGPDATAATTELLRWAVTAFDNTRIRVPANDEQLIAALDATDGWHRHHVALDVFRDTSLALPRIRVDDNVRVASLSADPDLDALHQLIYHDADWEASGAGYHEDRIGWRVNLVGHELRGALATDVTTGTPVGAVVGWAEGPGMVWMHRVAVATDQQGRGIAGGLLHQTLTDCRADGFAWLGVATHLDNTGALALYNKWNFDVQQQYLIYRTSA